MNFQDISEFLDLIKNPAKYEKYLTELKDAKDQLQAAAELVGKANEIEKLQTKATKLVEKAEAKAADIQAEAEAAAAKRQEAYDQLFAELAQKEAAFTKAKQETDSKFAQAQDLVKEYNEKSRQLRADQKAYDVAAADLAKKTEEVEDKLAKLRALMGN